MQQTYILIIGGAGGAIATFVLQKYGISAVVASAIVGLIGAYIGYLLSSNQLAEVIFVGSFVGMTSLAISSLPLMLIAGIGAGFLYSISTSMFPEYGGRLGALALIAVIFTFFLKNISKKR